MSLAQRTASTSLGLRYNFSITKINVLRYEKPRYQLRLIRSTLNWSRSKDYA